MAMEVVWIRAFAPVVKTQVYSFAWWSPLTWPPPFWLTTLPAHLAAKSARPAAELLALLCAAAFLPVLVNDPGG